MSNSNKKVREEVERRYGKKCMLHEGLNIKGYKYSKCKYKGVAIREQLSLHHIKPRRENGETSVRNSAVLCRGCHDFVEQVSEAQRQQLNNALQEYKRKIDEARECKIELVDTLDIGIEVKVAEISFSEEIKSPKEKFNRAKVKEETRKKIREWEERKIMAKESQKQRVIKYIKDFGSITPAEAFTELGAYRLSAIIYDLKHKDGYNIKTEIQSGKNRYGEATHFARYSFVEQDEEVMKHIPSVY